MQRNYDKLKEAYIEKGATWIEEQHQFLLKIFKKFKIEIREQHSEGDNIYLHRDTPMTVTEVKKDSRFGPHIINFLDKVDHLASLYDKYVLTPNDNKYRSNRMLSEFDSKLVSEFLEENCLTE